MTGRPPALTPARRHQPMAPFISPQCMSREHARCRQAEARPPEPKLGVSYDACSCGCHEPEQAAR